MYESNEKKKINWKGLIIKVLIILIVLVIILWIFPLGKKKDNYSDEFKKNITKLKDVGSNYFDKDNLPKDVGDTIKVSLKDLVSNNKIDTLKVNKNTCNEDDSYIKIIKKSKGYELETTLICGEEKNTSYSYLGCIDNCEDSTTTTTTTTTTTITKKTTTSTKMVTTTVKPTTTTTTTQAKFAVIFNRNMGSDVTTVYVNKYSIVGKPVDPVREGYVFAGWYLDGELYEFNTPVKSNIVLIAKWVRKEQ